MKITWDDDFGKRDEQLRERARKHLERMKSQLPRLTKPQAETIIAMMLKAYDAGQFDGWVDADITERQKIEKRAARGVEARRAKSPCPAIRAEFEAARKAGKDVTVKQLAKRHRASVPTVYRALRGLLRPGKN